MKFFHDFFARFTSVVKTIVAFILPIAESSAGSIIAAALPLAKDIVANMMTQGLKGNAARDAAVTKLKDQLTTQGIKGLENLGMSTLNFIIETALSHLNATK